MQRPRPLSLIALGWLALGSACAGPRGVELVEQSQPLPAEERADGVAVSVAGWSATLPLGWRATDPGRPNYLEAPDGSAGAYFAELTLDDQDLDAAVRLVHEVSRKSLPDGPGAWKVIHAEETFASDRAEMLTDYYRADARYRISERIIGRQRSIVRMTFHDYVCPDPEHSGHRPEVWLASLRLR